jgi:tripartite-type tricarboxylate transporter receptor subunit TctC
MKQAMRRHAVLFALTLGLFPTAALHAQSAYPAKPIRLVVAWPTGTPADVAGRIVAEKMAQGLGQPIVVDNKPGASGTIGLADLLRQPADGYTLYSLSSASLVSPLLYPSQGIDFQKTLEPIGSVVWSYNVLVTPVTSTIKDAADLDATAKAKPDALSFPSGGNGTPAHLAGELFKQQTGVSATHVPYNQFGLAIGDLISGRTQFMFLTASAAIPQINGGKLRPLAVTGAQRLPALKDIPTMAEQGYREFVLRSFDALMVKTGTPRDIVDRLQAEAHKALAHPEVRQKLAALALEPEAGAPRALASVIAAEQDKWLRIGRAAQIKAD